MIVRALNFPTRTKEEKERNVGWIQIKRMALHAYSIPTFLLYFFPGIKIKNKEQGQGNWKKTLWQVINYVTGMT